MTASAREAAVVAPSGGAQHDELGVGEFDGHGRTLSVSLVRAQPIQPLTDASPGSAWIARAEGRPHRISASGPPHACSLSHRTPALSHVPPPRRPQGLGRFQTAAASSSRTTHPRPDLFAQAVEPCRYVQSLGRPIPLSVRIGRAPWSDGHQFESMQSRQTDMMFLVVAPSSELKGAGQAYDRLSHDEAIARKLQVMDTAAFALTRDNGIPIVVFSVDEPGAIPSALLGKRRAT